jgi:hypothetical protein
MSGNPYGSRSSAGRFAPGLLTLRYADGLSLKAFHRQRLESPKA